MEKLYLRCATCGEREERTYLVRIAKCFNCKKVERIERGFKDRARRKVIIRTDES